MRLIVVDRGGFVSETDRLTLEQYPTFVEDPANYFTLLAEDLELVLARYGSAAHVAGGLQIGAMRLLGFVPLDLTTAPSVIIDFVAGQSVSVRRNWPNTPSAIRRAATTLLTSSATSGSIAPTGVT